MSLCLATEIFMMMKVKSQKDIFNSEQIVEIGVGQLV